MVNQHIEPTTSKNVKTEPIDDYIKIEVDSELIKTDIEETTNTINFMENSEDEEDFDMINFDKVITVSKPWSTYCIHRSQEELTEHNDDVVKSETNTETTRRSIGVNTDGPK